MRLNASVLGAASWLFISAFLLWAGHDLGIGHPSEPGSGFVIFWGGALIALFAGWILATSLGTKAERIASLWEGARWGKVVIVVAALTIYATTLSWLGFLLATVPLMLCLLRAIDPVPWGRALAVAVGSTVGAWWVLERLLSIRLPAGLLG